MLGRREQLRELETEFYLCMRSLCPKRSKINVTRLSLFSIYRYRVWVWSFTPNWRCGTGETRSLRGNKRRKFARCGTRMQENQSLFNSLFKPLILYVSVPDHLYFGNCCAHQCSQSPATVEKIVSVFRSQILFFFFFSLGFRHVVVGTACPLPRFLSFFLFLFLFLLSFLCRVFLFSLPVFFFR